VTARQFQVYVNTVKRLVVRFERDRTLKPRPIPGAQRQIAGERETVLRERLQAAPDATVLEHCAWWEQTQGQHLSEATMWRALRRLGWTHKQNGHSERTG
jgi:transposase